MTKTYDTNVLRHTAPYLYKGKTTVVKNRIYSNDKMLEKLTLVEIHCNLFCFLKCLKTELQVEVTSHKKHDLLKVTPNAHLVKFKVAHL